MCQVFVSFVATGFRAQQSKAVFAQDDCGFSRMVDQTGVVPVRRAEGAADLPEDRRVRQRPSGAREMVDQIFTSWNRIMDWVGRVEALKRTA